MAQPAAMVVAGAMVLPVPVTAMARVRASAVRLAVVSLAVVLPVVAHSVAHRAAWVAAPVVAKGRGLHPVAVGVPVAFRVQHPVECPVWAVREVQAMPVASRRVRQASPVVAVGANQAARQAVTGQQVVLVGQAGRRVMPAAQIAVAAA